MVIIVCVLSLIFIAIGFVITPNNARYLLSGYNTMSEEERAKIDIVTYLRFFKRFHIFLGMSLLVVVLGLHFWIDEDAAGVVLVMYPLLAYLFFAVKSSRGMVGRKQRKTVFLPVVLMIVVIIGVTMLLRNGTEANPIELSSEELIIEGMYGERIPRKSIKTVELVDELPKITLRTNGFAMGSHKKGKFKTKEGKIVTLLINTKNKPYLKLKTEKREIYINSGDISARELYQKIKEN
jgi:hypothetical protein